MISWMWLPAACLVSACVGVLIAALAIAASDRDDNDPDGYT